MSNLEAAPAEVACAASQHLDASPTVEVLQPREVPLGGPRTIRVQRTLPQRRRSLDGRDVSLTITARSPQEWMFRRTPIRDYKLSVGCSVGKWSTATAPAYTRPFGPAN
jgi:hypothetical protein